MCYSLFNISLLKKNRLSLQDIHKTICFSNIFFKEAYFFKQTSKFIILVNILAIFHGFFICFQLMFDKMVVSNIFIVIKYVIIHDRLKIFNLILCIIFNFYIFVFIYVFEYMIYTDKHIYSM